MLSITGNEVRLRKPVIYQDMNGEKQEIAGGFQLRGREVGFKVQDYDRAQPLVIDPVLVYSTYLGGSKGEQDRAIALE